MADGRKTTILKRVMEEGYTDSYGTLLHLTAVMGSDPKALEPNSDEELAEWRGHLNGLRAALLAVAMHEHKLKPRAAALVVERHLLEATNDLYLEQGDDTGTEG